MSAVLEYFDTNDDRDNGVTEIGVDEHIWHHRQPRNRGLFDSAALDDVTAAGLRARLTALDRQWDTLLPETSHTDPHTRTDTGELS